MAAESKDPKSENPTPSRPMADIRKDLELYTLCPPETFPEGKEPSTVPSSLPPFDPTLKAPPMPARMYAYAQASVQMTIAYNSYQTRRDLATWKTAVRLIRIYKILAAMHAGITKILNLYDEFAVLPPEEQTQENYIPICVEGMMNLDARREHVEQIVSSLHPNFVKMNYRQKRRMYSKKTKEYLKKNSVKDFKNNMTLLMEDLLETYNQCLDEIDKLFPEYESNYMWFQAEYKKLLIQKEIYEGSADKITS